MEEKIDIHTMKEDEINSVANLWNKLIYNQRSRDIYYLQDLQSLLNIDMKPYFKACFSNSKCCIFVAEYKKKTVGFVEMWAKEKDYFFSYDDYVYLLQGIVDRNVKIDINPLFIPFKLLEACENKARKWGYKYIGGDVFDFNTQMKALTKLYKVQPYRIRYMKKLIEDKQ